MVPGLGFGCVMICLEVMFSSKEDVLSAFGFILMLHNAAWLPYRCNRLQKKAMKLLLAEVRRLRWRGVCWLAVPCASWIFMSLGYVLISYSGSFYVWQLLACFSASAVYQEPWVFAQEASEHPW